MNPNDTHMSKRDAVEMLGGTYAAVARAIGITRAAVAKWPDILPPRLVDRVIAAQWRIDHAIRLEAKRRFARDSENNAISGKR